mgnify:CR=1 FL=1
MRSLQRALATALLALAVIYPAAAQDVTPAPVETLAFTSEAARLTFAYPADWAIRDGRTVYLGTSADMLDWRLMADAAIAPGEAAIQLELVRLADLPAGESGALRLATALRDDLSRSYAVSAVDSFTSGGRAAALVSAVAQGFEASVILLDAAPGEVFAILLAAAPDESLLFEAALVTVIDSLALAPALESADEATAGPTATVIPVVTPLPLPAPGARVPFESAALGLRFDYPETWTVTDGLPLYISTDPDQPTWDFGDSLAGGQAALNIQIIPLADIGMPLDTAPGDFLEAALAGVPPEFNVSDITERAFENSGTGALVTITHADFDTLALVLPGHPGELIGIQAGTPPGALDAFAPLALALADSLEVLPLPTPEPAPEAVVTTDAFTFAFPGDWSLGTVSARRVEVGMDMLTALMPPRNIIPLGDGRVEVELLDVADARAFLADLAGAEAVAPLTVVERDGWQAVIAPEDASSTAQTALLVALETEGCALLVRASGFAAPPETVPGVALVLESLTCVKDSAGSAASE